MLTASLESELAKIADTVLRVPALEKKETDKIATFSSQVAIDYILNVLFSTLYQINYTQNREHQRKSAELLNSFLP